MNISVQEIEAKAFEEAAGCVLEMLSRVQERKENTHEWRTVYRSLMHRAKKRRTEDTRWI